jgi:signal transduction histidine kinase
VTATLRRGARLPLRLRVTATFALITLLLTLGLSLATYLAVRSYLVDSRERLGTRQAFLNARVAKSLLLGGESSPADIVGSLGSDSGSQVMLNVDDQWFASSVAIDPDQLPGDLLIAAAEGSAARQTLSVVGVPHLGLAVPMPAASAVYVEVVPLRELDRTLSTVATALLVGSGITVVAGSIAGWVASRRLLRPLDRMSNVAVAIAHGGFDQRLDDEGDADLEPLVSSFNEMVDALQGRIERETRFASEVSHELRTPLTALSTAVEVVRRRGDELPERMRPAIAVIDGQISYFERLVLDLLEISRLDAGVERASPEDVDLRVFVERLAEVLDTPKPTVSGSGPWDLQVDKRRLERVLANLVENADRHGGGVTAIALDRDHDHFRVAIEDRGPGIPPEDRERVFERFWRGVASRRSSNKGTGLGMTLVAQHLEMIDGEIRIEANDGGGTRIVVELPAPNGHGP